MQNGLICWFTIDLILIFPFPPRSNENSDCIADPVEQIILLTEIAQIDDIVGNHIKMCLSIWHFVLIMIFSSNQHEYNCFIDHGDNLKI